MYLHTTVQRYYPIKSNSYRERAQERHNKRGGLIEYGYFEHNCMCTLPAGPIAQAESAYEWDNIIYWYRHATTLYSWFKSPYGMHVRICIYVCMCVHTPQVPQIRCVCDAGRIGFLYAMYLHTTVQRYYPIKSNSCREHTQKRHNKRGGSDWVWLLWTYLPVHLAGWSYCSGWVGMCLGQHNLLI